MKPYFADTFVFLAWWNRRDHSHRRVPEFLPGWGRRSVPTRRVVMGVGGGVPGAPLRREVRGLFEEMERDEQIAIVEPTDALYRRALALYDARPDKEWSLTDCISFVVMADEGLVDALTEDRHFEQAGFKALLV